MNQAYYPEAQRAHERLVQQTEIFINQGGHIEQVGPGITGNSVNKKRILKERTAKPSGGGKTST